MRLIDADALREDIETINYADWNNYSDTVDFIDDAPTIEAEPVKHGYWIDRTTWFGGIGACEYECSNCGYRVMHKPNSRGDGKGGKFCDNCGAKMDRGEENETD